MDPLKKRLEDQTYAERMAGLAAAANGPQPMGSRMPVKPLDRSTTPEEQAKMEAVQQMLLANSPTQGMVQPNAADLAAQDANFNSAMDELGEGVEVPAQPKRFQRLLGK